jgi:hypothetical protein
LPAIRSSSPISSRLGETAIEACRMFWSHHRLVYSVQGKENWSSFSVPVLRQNTKLDIADRQSIACSRHVRPSGVQQRGLKKAAERPSAGSRETAGRSSAGSVTTAAVRR